MTAYPALKTTFFVGRETELCDIAELMNDPCCRLLTLTGLGGIGKTRLAMEYARRQKDTFANGFCFAPLQGLHSHENIVSAVAESFQCPISPKRALIEQLLEYLHEKSLLLVLDNFEHLLDGVHSLSDILVHAPQVKILTTSRERLNIVEEWVYEVGGLSFPTHESETEIETYSAVQLFMHNARRVQHSFALTPAQKSAVNRICWLVGGMPLGIELASAWVRVLPCETIADEIERSLDILETTSANMPPRHRNMRAVFESMWDRLSQFEQEVFKKLSVFRGSFTLEAAECIAGASRPILRTLIDQCFLQIDSAERYALHELLRQYGAEKLGDSPQLQEEVNNLHRAYFMGLLTLHGAKIVFFGHQKEAIQKLNSDGENIRVAWQRAVTQELLEEICQAAEGLWSYY